MEFRTGADPNYDDTEPQSLLNSKLLSDFLLLTIKYPPKNETESLLTYYKRVALLTHPDKTGGIETEFKTLNDARTLLFKKFKKNDSVLSIIVPYLNDRNRRQTAAAAAGGAGGPSGFPSGSSSSSSSFHRPPAAAAAASEGDDEDEDDDDNDEGGSSAFRASMGGSSGVRQDNATAGMGSSSSFRRNPPDNATAGMGSSSSFRRNPPDNATAGMGGSSGGGFRVPPPYVPAKEGEWDSTLPENHPRTIYLRWQQEQAQRARDMESLEAERRAHVMRGEQMSAASAAATAAAAENSPLSPEPTFLQGAMSIAQRIAERHAREEWDAGASEREEEAKRRAKERMDRTYNAAQAKFYAEKRAELARATYQAHRRFIERYGNIRPHDHTPYQLALIAATRAANRRREEAEMASMESAAAWNKPPESKRTRVRSPPDKNSGGGSSSSAGGSSSSAAAAVAAVVTPEAVWLAPGVQDARLVPPTSEEMELFFQDGFWTVLAEAACRDKSKRKNFIAFGRPGENFDTFYQRVKNFRILLQSQGYRISVEEPSNCTTFGGYRKRSTRSKKGHKGRKSCKSCKSRRHSRK